MFRIFNILIFLVLILTNNINAKESFMILKLKDGDVKIEMFSDVAPNHVKRILELVIDCKYNGVAFHRVIEGFMAQTGDIKFGNINNPLLLSDRSGARVSMPGMMATILNLGLNDQTPHQIDNKTKKICHHYAFL